MHVVEADSVGQVLDLLGESGTCSSCRPCRPAVDTVLRRDRYRGREGWEFTDHAECKRNNPSHDTHTCTEGAVVGRFDFPAIVSGSIFDQARKVSAARSVAHAASRKTRPEDLSLYALSGRLFHAHGDLADESAWSVMGGQTRKPRDVAFIVQQTVTRDRAGWPASNRRFVGYVSRYTGGHRCREKRPLGRGGSAAGPSCGSLFFCCARPTASSSAME